MLETMQSHASVRRYQIEVITEDKLKELLFTAQHAASSNFVQAYSVINITDKKKEKKLAKLSKNELQFETSALSLVFCADLKRVEIALQNQSKEIKADTYENFLVSIIDTALFAQNFVVACESEGYGISYIGGVRNNPEEISQLLDLPDKVIPLFGMTVGVPNEQNEVKPRFPIEAILHYDKYDQFKYKQLIEEYDKIMNKYYNSRANSSRNTNWTKEMIDFMTEFRRPHMKEFLERSGYLRK